MTEGKRQRRRSESNSLGDASRSRQRGQGIQPRDSVHALRDEQVIDDPEIFERQLIDPAAIVQQVAGLAVLKARRGI